MGMKDLEVWKFMSFLSEIKRTLKRYSDYTKQWYPVFGPGKFNKIETKELLELLSKKTGLDFAILYLFIEKHKERLRLRFFPGIGSKYIPSHSAIVELYEREDESKRVDITPNWVRDRQFDPDRCQENSFRIKKTPGGKHLVLCKLKKTGKQAVQSIRTRRKEEDLDAYENETKRIMGEDIG